MSSWAGFFIAGFLGFLLLADWIFLPREARRAWISMAILFTGAALLALNPTPLIEFARFIGIGRGVDVVLYVFCIVLVREFFLSRYRQSRMEQQFTELVRAQAIESARKR